MLRRARMYLPGYPYHIVQRGNNRNACFVAPQDYQFYLELWEECSQRYGVAIHAYCLMTNHVHLLVTPGNSDSVSFATKVIGSRYAQYFNKTYKRTGTLWEGRHKSSLVQSERYYLTCSRYIELNPVAANMVSKPERNYSHLSAKNRKKHLTGLLGTIGDIHKLRPHENARRTQRLMQWW